MCSADMGIVGDVLASVGVKEGVCAVLELVRGESNARRRCDALGVVGWDAQGKSWRVVGQRVRPVGAVGESVDEERDASSSVSDAV